MNIFNAGCLTLLQRVIYFARETTHQKGNDECERNGDKATKEVGDLDLFQDNSTELDIHSIYSIFHLERSTSDYCGRKWRRVLKMWQGS